MICPNCSTQNEPGRKFCGECGARLAVACATCGTANAPGTRFCGECGTQLDATAPARGAGAAAGEGYRAIAGAFAGDARPHQASSAGPIAERRLVTVQFADLVGLTSL